MTWYDNAPVVATLHKGRVCRGIKTRRIIGMPPITWFRMAAITMHSDQRRYLASIAYLRGLTCLCHNAAHQNPNSERLRNESPMNAKPEVPQRRPNEIASSCYLL